LEPPVGHSMVRAMLALRAPARSRHPRAMHERAELGARECRGGGARTPPLPRARASGREQPVEEDGGVLHLVGRRGVCRSVLLRRDVQTGLCQGVDTGGLQ